MQSNKTVQNLTPIQLASQTKKDIMLKATMINQTVQDLTPIQSSFEKMFKNAKNQFNIFLPKS